MTEVIYVQEDSKKREATQEEIQQLKIDQAQALEIQKAIVEEEDAKKASKKSAIEKLTALGLTEKEVVDLLGITPDEPEAE